MIKISRAFLLVFFVSVYQFSSAQDFLKNEYQEGQTYVLLANPTVKNITTVQFLLEQDIFHLPKVQFVGVYSSAEKYDYSKTKQFLKDQGLSRFHLQQIEGEEPVGRIYQQNDWTAVFTELVNKSAGIVFFGGPDIQPEAYNQENSYSVVTDPNRHLFELSFLFHLLGGSQNPEFVPLLKQRPNYMVTGFCLGMQSMNVATGGTLTQDIPAQIYKKEKPEDILKLKKNQLHRNYWQEISEDTLLMGINFHPIEYTAHPFFLKKVRVKKIANPLVLSSHHQSIDELGQDLVVTAASMDMDVIEGVQHRIFPNVFAVQFHPEVPALYQEGKKYKFAPDDEPKTYSEIIGAEGHEFHLKYWQAISDAVKSSVRSGKR